MRLQAVNCNSSSLYFYRTNRCVVQFRVTQVKNYSWDNVQVLLIGNKCDLEKERVVSTDRGRELAGQLGLDFYESSVKQNVNVREAFERLVEIICEKMAESFDGNQAALFGSPYSLGGMDQTRLAETPKRGCSC